MCKLIPHVKIKIASDNEGGVGTVFSPGGKGTATYQHVILHGMSQIVSRMIIELALVGSTDKVVLMGTGERNAINFISEFFRDILS